MHLAKLKYSLFNWACCAGVTSCCAPADDELTLATLFEPPHAAARIASPAEAVIATATRSAKGDTRGGQRRTRLPSFIASPSVATVPVLALKTQRIFS
jgi:hypothetical protein